MRQSTRSQVLTVTIGKCVKPRMDTCRTLKSSECTHLFKSNSFSAVHVTPWIPREVPFRSWLDYDTKILRQMIMYYILYIVSTVLLFFALPSPVLVFHMSLYSTCVISQRCRVGVLPLRVINLQPPMLPHALLPPLPPLSSFDFNQPLNSWNVAQVTKPFNQDLDSWKVAQSD